MLPNIGRQNETISYIYSEKLNIDNLDEAELYCIRNYAKWYARRVIQHCAEVAKFKTTSHKEDVPLGRFIHTPPLYNYIDKQSILNVIYEL